MSKVGFRTFEDPYDYQESVRAAHVTGFTTGRGDFHAELLQIDLHRLWMQAGKETLSHSFHISLSGTRSPIFFLADANRAEMRHCGHEMASGEILFFGREASQYWTASTNSHWATMSLSPDQLAAAGLAIVGRELSAPDSTRVLRPEPNRLARLRRLHSAARHLAKTAPEIIAHPEVARALDQSLIEAMVGCMSDADDVEAGSGWCHHLAVMARLEEWLSTNSHRPAYLPEICNALKISKSTLYLCCQEHLGMSATHYLWLRRMHLANRALLRANPVETSVTAIAMDHGFGELGRFAVGYRGLFGKSPRTTLQKKFDPHPASQAPPFFLSDSQSA